MMMLRCPLTIAKAMAYKRASLLKQAGGAAKRWAIAHSKVVYQDKT